MRAADSARDTTANLDRDLRFLASRRTQQWERVVLAEKKREVTSQEPKLKAEQLVASEVRQVQAQRENTQADARTLAVLRTATRPATRSAAQRSGPVSRQAF